MKLESLRSTILDQARLEKLRSLLLTDSPADVSFDRLTRLASRILNVPISLVTFVETGRQIFKSQVGLPEPWATIRETPLSHSFCKHSTVSKQPLVVENARAHPLVHNNLAIDDLGVVSYAGVPLLTIRGHVIGTFCVIDTQPRKWTKSELDILSDLAASVMTELELRSELLERRQAEKRLKESDLQYQQALNAINDLVLIKDSNSKIVWANKAFCDYYGMSNEELQGQLDAPDVRPDLTAQYLRDDALVFKTGQPLNISEEPIVRHDGEIRYFHTVKTPIFDLNNNIVMSIGVSRDITVRKESDTQIQLALKKERELNELKNRFGGMISHEFRNPLASIMNSSNLLESYSDKLTTEKKVLYFRRIRQQVNKLVSLLDDILIMNKLDSPSFSLSKEPVVLEKLCHEIVEELQVNTADHKLIIKKTGSTSPIIGDDNLIRYVLTNLLSNAIKYSPEGGNIITHTIYDDDTVLISVNDTGIGIPPGDVEKLFDPFYRASNIGRISGTGLGLAIVKHVVDLHEGDVSVDSKLGEGTVFTVSLPLAEANSIL